MEIVIHMTGRGAVDKEKTKVSGSTDWKIGDVIDYQTDGYDWGSAGFQSPEFRIVRLDITRAEAIGLLAQGQGDEKSEVIWRRRNFVDWSLLSQEDRDELLGPRGKSGVIDGTLKTSSYRAAFVLKPPKPVFAGHP